MTRAGVALGYVHDWRGEFGTFFQDRTALVTGSTGFVGGHVCRALADLGADVHGVSFAEMEPSPPRESWRIHQMDIRDERAVLEVMRRVEPDTVFHLAGVVDTNRSVEMVAPTLQANLVGTIHVLLAATTTRCRRVVVAGSAEELIDAAAGPLSPYAASKMAMDPYLRLFRTRYGVPVVSARPFVNYGPGQQRSKLIPYTVLQLLAGEEPVISSGDRLCDFVFIGDLVRGLLGTAVMDEVPACPIDIGSGHGTSIRSVVERIADLLGSSRRPRFEPSEDESLEPPQIAFEHGGRLPGWAPAWSLDEGLRLTCEWYAASTHRLELGETP